MTALPTLDRSDILLVVQSLAQVRRSGGEHPVSEASLFLQVRSLDGFSREQIESLAVAALQFFDLETDGPGGAPLRQELEKSADLETWAGILHANWNGEAVCFHSSGSTGVPARHRYTLRSLAGESAALAPYFTPLGRIVSVMPLHHIFGFMHSVWLGKWLDVPVVYAPPLPLASFFALLREGDVVMAFPFFWQSLLSVVRQGKGGGALRVPRGVMGVTSTGPCPHWVIEELLKSGPGGPVLAAVREVYGSTETNGIGVRCDGGEWYELGGQWETVTLPGGEKGIRRLVDGTRAGDPMALPDVIDWHPAEDRLFRPERRTDKAVQVGGINVYPDRVAACIRAHPLVRDCAVRLMRPEEGSRLKVFIVPECPLEEAAGHFGKPFRAWLAERLDTAGRPKRIRLGETLPVNAMGKLCDW
ncbi:Acyl-CoA synthetase, AMP-forming [uncultured delta proteobacterium]|uniref:Acyl-CoA synthetase, AMP-forming n=1 Tax=uncultured delta proteobacterium TaxID=34034 RepID=A0A212JFI1_9DELT|nr:Acyl-CoA synthetase, AMP-forming [uncultured delta proteobacterium]